MFTIHNAIFCCEPYKNKILHGTDIEHECTKTPVYIVDSMKEDTDDNR